MAVINTVHGGDLQSKFRSIPRKINNRQKPPIRPPIYISTNPTDVNPTHLRDLYSSCNHSCHRFPNLLPNGQIEPVDVNKLRIALAHSSVVVSVFSRLELIADSSSEISILPGIGGDWFQRVMPVTPYTGYLVGFGRAVSDLGLTASIYDVMVIPSLQRKGFGRMILQRIIRMLTNKGIYDIAALCSDQERGFFRACGFGEDLLKSTTMMYTRSESDPSSLMNNGSVKSAGRKLLIVPPLKESFQL